MKTFLGALLRRVKFFSQNIKKCEKLKNNHNRDKNSNLMMVNLIILEPCEFDGSVLSTI